MWKWGGGGGADEHLAPSLKKTWWAMAPLAPRGSDAYDRGVPLDSSTAGIMLMIARIKHTHTHTSEGRGGHRCEGLVNPSMNKQEMIRKTNYIAHRQTEWKQKSHTTRVCLIHWFPNVPISIQSIF